MMKKLYVVLFLGLVLSLMSANVIAQNKTNAYYDSHPSEILPDAQAAFRNGNYDRAVELCRLHYTIVGDNRADALKEKASQCARLTIEMNALSAAQNNDAAREKARAILALNPDDRKAKEVSAPPKPSTSSSSGSSAAQTTVRGTVTDASGVPIISCSVFKYVEGKLLNPTITDLDGAFSFQGLHRGDMLFFQCLGYVEQKVVWNGGPLKVVLDEIGGIIDGHEWVDLGLSVKWAVCNVGASAPEEYGDYFAWGETSPKSTYTWENYRFRKSGSTEYDVTFTKYNSKSRLKDTDDAARANWGGSWRMPTNEEWTELRTECTWTWSTQGDKCGYKVTSPINGNSIFLPAAGWRDAATLRKANSEGAYWSSSIGPNAPESAWGLYFNSGPVADVRVTRYYGSPVRPVTK